MATELGSWPQARGTQGRCWTGYFQYFFNHFHARLVMENKTSFSKSCIPNRFLQKTVLQHRFFRYHLSLKSYFCKIAFHRFPPNRFSSKHFPHSFFPESVSEGFLLCGFSAGAKLSFPGALRARCRSGAAI